MRRVSLNMREAQDGASSAEIFAVLIEITHPDLPQPIRLSTDNTVRLSSDPIYYGTRSTWRGANPLLDPYLWIVASVLLPSDEDDAPASAQLAIENLDSRIVEMLLSFTTVATACIAIVRADAPNEVEDEYFDLDIVTSDIDAGQIALSLSREQIEMEHFPGDRMTRQNFPGLFV